jgi:hypothetical protein
LAFATGPRTVPGTRPEEGCGAIDANLFRAQARYIRDPTTREAHNVSILWIILIVILVLALLGFFGRGRF